LLTSFMSLRSPAVSMDFSSFLIFAIKHFKIFDRPFGGFSWWIVSGGVALLHADHKRGLMCTTVYLWCLNHLFCIRPGLMAETIFCVACILVDFLPLGRIKFLACFWIIFWSTDSRNRKILVRFDHKPWQNLHWELGLANKLDIVCCWVIFILLITLLLQLIHHSFVDRFCREKVLL
jgi:hypothetical protein